MYLNFAKTVCLHYMTLSLSPRNQRFLVFSERPFKETLSYQIGGNQKLLILLTNVDKKSFETVFDCHLSSAFENTVSSNF